MTLDNEEAKEKVKEKKESSVSYISLYRFATKFELFLIFLGVVFTIIKAFGMPLMIITYGEFTTLLVDRTYREGTTSKTVLLQIFGGGKVLTNATQEENRIEIINDSVSYGILMTLVSLIQFIAGIFCIDLFNYTALKQVTRIRIKYFSSLIRQEVGWYDVSKDTNFAVQISEDIEKIRNGIAERVSHYLCLMTGFIICVTISFVYGWKLTLVVIGYVPIIIVTNMIISRFQVSLTGKESSAYAIAAAAAEEVLGGIRTVKAFCGEKKESTRYNNLLIPAQKAGIRKGLFSGIGEAVMRFMFYASNALAYWYGVSLVLYDRDKEEKEYTPAVLMIAFFGLIVGADNISKTSPFLECFSAAQGAAHTIFGAIDRKSKIDSLSIEGKIINYGVKGEIEFENIFFQYPSRPDVQILNGLNMKVQSGETVALVGSSGNGKSTCIQLLQRFYDPSAGKILIDGNDIKQLNLSYLRSNFGVVGQEPVLFSTTIEENIRYGKPDATQKEIEEAAKNAGAHEFIMTLQDGYQTYAGQSGCQISGGQKQRIAIARALIRNPKILLLDEATSALDTHSEKLVQETLNKISKGKTTIVVSHRLSAICNADRILFIDKGQILEQGTHDDLIKLQGRYYQMMKHGISDTETDQLNNETDNENIKQEKCIEKQLFTDTQNQLPAATSTSNTTQLKENKKVEEEEVQEKIHSWQVFKRIMITTKPEWFYLIIASISALIIGASFPVFAILFGEFYGALAMGDPDAATESTRILCIAFLVMGIIVGLAGLLQTHLFNMTGVYLTTRTRAATLKSMVSQDISWFDDPKNATGALSVRLASDASTMQGAIGYPLSGIIQSISTFIFGVTISFIYLWKMALVILPTAPLVVLSVLFEAKYMENTANLEASGLEEVTKIATETISNIRTVASLRQESHIIKRYDVEIKKLEKTILKKMSLRGLVNSTGQSIPFFGYALALYYGGLMVANEGVHFKNIIKVSEGLLYGTMMLGQSLAFAPAFTAAIAAGQRLINIIDRKSTIISPEKYNIMRKPDKSSTAVFRHIDFRYPTRPDVLVLDSFDLEVFDGKTVALVGSSGCGKSTCIQLLQRFYDPEQGRIYLGLDEISRDISIKDLRSKMSIVSQEPILFDRSIAENIAYGDNDDLIDMNDIIDAAKMANIHDFIIGLPQGYETKLGIKGTQLSGGQKQRIAIARALVNNPKVLLLDEATSALDLQSEKVVQSALDLARSGRTCLIIAHRLSTIQNADVICVIQNGKVCEQGTHNQLMSMGGAYSKLFKSQPKVN